MSRLLGMSPQDCSSKSNFVPRLWKDGDEDTGREAGSIPEVLEWQNELMNQDNSRWGRKLATRTEIDRARKWQGLLCPRKAILCQSEFGAKTWAGMKIKNLKPLLKETNSGGSAPLCSLPAVQQSYPIDRATVICWAVLWNKAKQGPFWGSLLNLWFQCGPGSLLLQPKFIVKVKIEASGYSPRVL